MKGEELITEGLLAEFRGEAQYFSRVDANGIEIKSATYETPELTYTDEYENARVTKGKDRAKSKKKGRAKSKTVEITREYGGQTEDNSVLEPLGITEAKVFEFLIEVILAHGPLTRLANDFSTTDEDWKYEYVVTYKDKDETEVLGTEKIFYKGVQVFFHEFNISVNES